MKHKILLHTNFPSVFSGLAENGRLLAKWLDRTGKYDIVYYGSQAHEHHTDIPKLPYKTLGCITLNQGQLDNLQRSNFQEYRSHCYGGANLHKIIEQEKPTIYWGSDDVWAFQPNIYNSDWFAQINSVLHITVDSVPISPMAYEQAKKTPNFVTWAKFAQKEMARWGTNVKHVYGTSDVKKFKPVSKAEKKVLRAKFGIPQDTTIFIYLGRNQLRKEFGSMLQAYALFKQENPNAKAKLLLHTSFNEGHNQGFDIPQLIKFSKIPNEDVYTTMFCRQCKEWEVRPYTGENTDCRFCGTKKAQVSCTIQHAVPHDELYQVYGIADAAISPFTSGGLEFHNVNSLLCGLPLACTNYSCGEDFCEQPFVYPIKWHTRFEANTSFLKATNDIHSIKGFMEQMYRKSEAERDELGTIGRDWAAKTFSIEAVGPQWEKLFDAMPFPDWSKIDLKPKLKNPDFPLPTVEDNVQFVKELYRGALDVIVSDTDTGLKDWLESLRQGRSRESIHAYFINEAAKENVRLTPPKPFEDMFDKNDREKILYVMKESGGDIAISTASLKGIKELYPNADIYYACDPKYNELLEGNSYIYKVLSFVPEMESEMLMMQYVNYYFYPASATQKFLKYLTQDKIALELK